MQGGQRKNMPEAARKMDKTLCKATQAPGTGTFTVVTGETAMVKIGNDWAVCKDDPYACTGANPPANAPTPCTTGKVTKGSSTVLIGNKEAARKDDLTKCDGTSAMGNILTGEPTVIIGDSGGGGGGGGGSGGGGGGGGGGAATEEAESDALTSEAAGEGDSSGQAGSGCTNPDCAEAFQQAAGSGTALVDRHTTGC